MKLYGLKTCDTCRRAFRALPSAEFVDVRADGVPQSVMQAAFSTFGAALLNTRSTTWRGLSEVERKRPPLELLRDYPALMKRPLIDDGSTQYLGWGKDVQTSLGV